MVLTKRFLKIFAIIIAVLFFLYCSILTFFYFKQEKFFFNPKYLKKDYTFKFKENFEEIYIPVDKGVKLNALLFKANNSKGVVLYLHGNAGALHDWGRQAHLYLNNNYDVLFLDYRGYGKSDGTYSKDTELFQDVQKTYDYLKTRYNENKIIVLGFSLGSGVAAYLASKNNPKLLILNAPYYNWQKLVSEEIAPILPKFLIRYNIPTYQFLKKVNCYIYVFYGTKDFLINPSTNAIQLKKLYPQKIKLKPIEDAPHNALHITKTYHDELKMILE